MTRKNHDDEIVTRGILKKELKIELTGLRKELQKELAPMKADIEMLKGRITELPTKKELKDWLSDLPTKQDLLVWKDEGATIMKNERLEDTNVRGAHQRYEEDVKNHETRIAAL